MKTIHLSTLTKELIIDFGKKGGEQGPIHINGTEVERVNSVKFLGVTITGDLAWTSHAYATVKKAQQCLLFLRWLRKFAMSIRSLTNFYRCTTESILSRCMMAWYGNCFAQASKKLEGGVHSPDHHGSQPSSHGFIYTVRCCGKVANIIKDPSHPANDLLQPLVRQKIQKPEHTHKQVQEQRFSSRYQTVEWTLASNNVTCNVICMPMEYRVLFWLPCYRKDVTALEREWKRFTRKLPGMENISYHKRLDRLGLFFLVEKWLRIDLIENYKSRD
eukprot:g30749.t1